MGTDFCGNLFFLADQKQGEVNLFHKCDNEMKNEVRDCYATPTVTERGDSFSVPLCSLGSREPSSHQFKTGNNRRLQEGPQMGSNQV